MNPEDIDYQEMLELLEIRNISQATSTQISFSCPLPGHSTGDENPSASMNSEHGAWICYACKAHGSSTDFVAQVLGVSPLEARRMLKERYAPGYIDPNSRSMVSEVKKLLETKLKDKANTVIDEKHAKARRINWGEAERAYMINRGHPSTDYMFSRHFDAGALIKYDIGYDAVSNRITIPVRDESGALVGFKARAFDSRLPKYLVLGDNDDQSGLWGFPRYRPSKVVFNAHRHVGKNLPAVVVCEGEFNAMAVERRTTLPAVAINGSNFTSHHAYIIKNIAQKAILFLDSDDAGIRATFGYKDNEDVEHPGIAAQLSPFMDVEIVPSHYLDPAEMTDSEIKYAIDNAKSWTNIQLEEIIGAKL